MLCLHAVHVPDIPMCLLSPQQIMSTPHQSHDKNHYIGTPTRLVLVYDGRLIHFPYNEALHLPVLKTTPGAQCYFAFCAQIKSSYMGIACPTPFYAQAFQASTAHAPRVRFDPSLDPDLPDDQAHHMDTPVFQDTTSLSTARWDLLHAHHHFGHVGFCDIQQWAREGKYGLPQSLGHCRAPICLTCQYGQARKKPHPSTTGGLSDCADSPGAFVSIDHMVSGIGGHIPFHVGHPSSCQYKYCSLWADHYSKFLFGHLQEHTNTCETIQSKEAFESFASRYDIRLKHVHSDNGVFASAEFAQHLDAHAQSHSLCGISAHWQNGVVE